MAPQVSGATRKSPGLTNLMYSADSFSHSVKARSGRFARFLKAALRGCTCAFSLTELYSGESGAVPGATPAEEFPPWQSVQSRCTVFVGCIVGSSVEVWHEMQPMDFFPGGSTVWLTLDVAPGFSPAWFVGAECNATTKDNAETQSAQSAQRFRTEDAPDLWKEVIAARLRK